MTEHEPAQRLLADIARLRAGSAERDRRLARLGAALMAIGPALAAVGYLQSSQAPNQLNQNDAIIVALVGVTAAIVGTGLFLRYSLGELLRFWMARMIAEQQRPVAPIRRPQPEHRQEQP